MVLITDGIYNGEMGGGGEVGVGGMCDCRETFLCKHCATEVCRFGGLVIFVGATDAVLSIGAGSSGGGGYRFRLHSKTSTTEISSAPTTLIPTAIPVMAPVLRPEP